MMIGEAEGRKERDKKPSLVISYYNFSQQFSEPASLH
jgi:hypothetical protein